MNAINRFAAVAALWFAVGIVGAEKAEATDYWLAGSDGGGASSMNMTSSPAGWATSSTGSKVAHTPTSGNIYHVGTDSGGARLLRTPTTPSAYTFPGSIVMEGGSIAHKGPQNGTVTIPYLTCESPYTSRISIATGFPSTSPNNAFNGTLWTIEAGAVLNTTESSGGSAGLDYRDIKFSTKIVGAGMIQAAQSNASATEANRAVITYDGDLSEFTGKVEGSNTTASNGGLTIRFTKATALTAGPSAFDAESVAILKGTTLSFGESVVTHPNRGFTFDRAVVNVDANKRVTLGGSVTAANGFTLKGAGTLSLAADNSNLAGTVSLANGATLELAHAGAAGTATIAGPTTSGQSAKVAINLVATDPAAVSLANLPTGNVTYEVKVAQASAGQEIRPFVLSGAATAPSPSNFTVTAGDDNYVVSSVEIRDGAVVLVLAGEAPPPPRLELLGGSKNQGDEGGMSSMANLGNPPGWSDGSKAAIAGKDYRVSNAGYQLRTPAYGQSPKSYAFAGRRLYYYAGQLVVKIPQGYTLTVPRLIVEENGRCTVNGYWDHSEYPYNLNNDMHLAGDEWQILKGGVLKLDLNVGTETQNGRAYALDAPLTGEGTLFCNCAGTYANHSLRIRLNGDLSGFTGPLVFNGTSGTTFEFTANATAPGAMTATGVGLAITGAVSMAFNCDLTLDATRGVEIAGGCPTLTVVDGKTVTVKGSFNAASGFVKKGKGLLILEDTSIDPMVIDVQSGIVRLPNGIELGGKIFELRSPGDSMGSSSMSGAGTPAGWSNGKSSAEAGLSYRVSNGYQLRTPDYSTDKDINQSYTFPGEILLFTNGSVGVKILQNNSLAIPSLFVETNGYCVFSSIWNNNYKGFDANTDTHLRGNSWVVSPGGRLELNASVSNAEQNQRAYALDAPLTGEGTLFCNCAGTYANHSLRIRLNGDLSDFTGPLVFNGTSGTTFEFTANATAPGAMTATGVGIAITGAVSMAFNSDLTLDATRGVEIAGGCPTLTVAEDKTVTVKGPFNAASGFVKKGKGLLILEDTSVAPENIQVFAGIVRLPDGTELGGDVIVELCGSDGQGSSSMNGTIGKDSSGNPSNPGGWSNGSLAAEAGVSYRVSGGYQLRTPDYSTDKNMNQSYTFPGDCLRFANGIVGVKILQNNNLTIPSLFVETNGCCTFSSIWNNNYTGFDASTDTHLCGTTWTVSPGGRLELNASVSNVAQNQRAFALDAPLTGEGTLACTLGGTYGGLSLRVRLNGDLRGLTGQIVLKGTNGTAVVFREGVKGLGAMASAQSDGLSISGPVVVKFVEDFSLDATRGVTATGRPWIWVGKGKTLTVNGAFAAPDGFVAGGPGRIVLKNAPTLDTSKILVASGTVVLPDMTELQETSVPTLKANILTEYVTVNGGREGVLAAAAAVPALGANDKWSDINYAYTGRSNWEPLVHVQRCQKLAAAAALLEVEDSTTAQAYLATVVKAMNAWYVKVPTSENWYQSVIAVPQSVAYTAIFAEDYLKTNDPTLFGKMVANTETDLNNVNVQTGQNLVWVRGIRAMNALLNDDASLTLDHVEVLQNEVRVVAFGTEGIQDDWSFHQHGIQPQIANYGRQFLVDNVFWVRAFAGEFCAYPQAKLDILANLATNCFAWSAWKGTMSPDTMGRQIFLSMHSQGASMTNAIMRLLGEVAEPVGYRYFPRSAYAVNRSTNWMATVKMGTKQIRSTESGNYENILGKFLGDGAIYTYVTGEEYNDVYALWDDWRMVPGVTQLRGASVDWPNKPDVGGNFRTPNATISTGASRSVTFTYGPEEGLSYRKTWTFVDNGYDVSVAGITSTAASEVATCVESANAAAEAGLVTQNERYSVYHNGEIYYVVWAAPQDIAFTLEDRTGNVGDYATYYPREVSGRLFRIVVSHGRNPSGASFKYNVRIGGWDKEDVDPSPRTITVTGNRRVGGQRELTLSFTTPNLHWTNALVAAYGKTDAGDTLSGWDRLEVVANEVLPETTSLVWTTNCTQGDEFIRFFFVDPDLNALYQYHTYESIWSTNGGYIDTGLKFHNGDSAECLFQYKATATAPHHALFGCRVKAGEIVQAIIGGQDVWAHYWDNANTEMHAERNPSTWPNAWIKIHLCPDRRWLERYSTAWNTVKEDNRQYAGEDFTTQTNVWLFALSGAGCIGYDGNNKPIANNIPIRYMRMYDENNVLTRDLWAAKRLKDGAFGMYDKVENKFYLSANPAGGTFTGSVRYQNELLGLDLTKAQKIGESCRFRTKGGLVIMLR